MPTAPMRLVSQADKGAEAGRIQKRDAGQVDLHLDRGRAEGLHELAESPHGVDVERSVEGQKHDPLTPLTGHGERGHARVLLRVLRHVRERPPPPDGERRRTGTRRPEEVVGGGHGALPRRASFAWRLRVREGGWPSLSVSASAPVRSRGGKSSIAVRPTVLPFEPHGAAVALHLAGSRYPSSRALEEAAATRGVSGA